VDSLDTARDYAMNDHPCDLVVRNGTIIDGSGGPSFVGDVAIRGAQIVAAGDIGAVPSQRQIDARGLVVAPGFIDVHSHDDAALIARPEMAPKLTQGVTTVICGNCGISGAPYSRLGKPPGLLRLLFKSERFVAPSFAEYADMVSGAGPSINAGFLTGHSTLRMQVMGEALDRGASAAEISRMRSLLVECLEAGSLGLSTGLFYPPARAAPRGEVIQLGEPLAQYSGIYVTHMRDEADKVMESLHETLEIGRALRVPVIVSHHKCMGRRNFGRSIETLALLEHSRTCQPLALDLYPYTAGSSILSEEFVAQSSQTLITWCEPYPDYCGRDLAEIAREWNCDPVELVVKLQPAGALYFMMDEEDVTRIMRFPMAMIGSDGLPEDTHPHPRLWGTFPRVLGRYVRERGVLSLEDAIHRMTGLPASQFKIDRRGQIRSGNFADLCIFDPQLVCDAATYEEPTRPAVGIRHVLVNGQMALNEGQLTGTRAGRILLR
jgi:N-acyl-D-amino-acid deacylase